MKTAALSYGSSAAVLGLLVGSLWPRTALAAPTFSGEMAPKLRRALDVRGGYTIVGNTFTQDCRSSALA
jgi:hypothetical protein